MWIIFQYATETLAMAANGTNHRIEIEEQELDYLMMDTLPEEWWEEQDEDEEWIEYWEAIL